MFTGRHAHHDHAPEGFGANECPHDAIGFPRYGTHWSQWIISRGSVLLLLSLLAFVGVSPAFAQAATAGQITEFPLPHQGYPEGLVRGSDGNLWFATPATAMPATPAMIGRITSTGQITQFVDHITNASGAQDLTLGPDGNLWFFDRQGFSNEQIGRITPKGQIREFLIPSPDGNRVFGTVIAVGSDGNLWFTATTIYDGPVTGFIGRVTTAGVLTEFATPTTFSDPGAIARGSDGNLWFTEFGAGAIGRITPKGQITEFPLPHGGYPGGLVRGSDGNLWFATTTPATFGRITPKGQITQFAASLKRSYSAGSLTLGPDGNVWYADSYGQVNQIGRITPAGQIREFLIPAFQGNHHIFVNGMTVGPDGNLWFAATTFTGANNPAVGFIGRITTAGVITEFGTPTALSNPGAIISGSDGNVWFTEFAANAIGRITTH